MGMRKAPSRGSPPQAVADAPVGELVPRCDALSRAWLVELVSAWPIERIAELPLQGFALAGPGVCRAALRALAGEQALSGLGDTARCLRPLAPELAVRAVEALRRVLWDALVEELRGSQARARGAQAGRLAELADRLGAVCAALAASGVTRVDSPGRDVQPASGRVAPPIEPPVQAPRPRRLPSTASSLDGESGVSEPWLHAIGRRIELRARDGRPFAVLLVEVEDIQRLTDAEVDGDVAAALALAERVLLEHLRPGDELVREQSGRYWILAPDTEAAGARVLAGAFATAPRGLEGHRGVALSFAVGLALCGEDQVEARTIADEAENSLLAARSTGAGVAPA